MAKTDTNRYFVVKDRNDLSITYFEYDKVEGYDLQPRTVKIKDAIDVNRMIIINPSLIQKLAFRKVDSKFKKLVKLLMYTLSLSTDDEDAGSAYQEALNEISKLRLELHMYYKGKLKKDAFDDFCKRLEVLEKELQVRMYYYRLNYQNFKHNEMEREGKSR